MKTISQELKEKAEVAQDLISQGAEEVHITGTDIKVIGKRHAHPPSGGIKQVINVNAKAVAHSSAELAVRFHLVRMEIEETYKHSKDLHEIRKKLALLENELAKDKPHKSTSKKIITWALNTSWSLFLKIAPIIIDKHLSAVS